MRFGITGQFRTTLARGAAVLVVGGLSAGCSSGVSGLTDGLVTNSTGTNRPVTVAQLNQPYPGETYAGRRSQLSDQKVVRPKVPVGGAVMQRNAPTAFPAPSSASAPVYAAPAARTSVSSSPLPSPQSGQTQRSAPGPVATQQPARTASTPAPNAPQPAKQSSGQVAVLPQVPKVQEKSAAPSGNDTASSTFSGGTYTVVSGDTLYGIARKTGASVDSIKQANGLSSNGLIRIGQRLAIPSGSAGAGTAVASAAAKKQEQPEKSDPVTTSTAAVSTKKPEASKVSTYTPPSSDEEKVAEKAGESTELAALTPDSTGVERLRWPARGRVVSSFGSGGTGNDGIDIAVPEGTAVQAAENGVVIYAGDGLKGFGNTVLVRHEDGLVTVYGHASDIKVERGDKVKRGQEIALSGMSGDADRPKLHFEVRKGTSPVDPMTYLE